MRVEANLMETTAEIAPFDSKNTKIDMKSKVNERKQHRSTQMLEAIFTVHPIRNHL